jgi:predicted RNA binding protein YcfA (HicA-like mRNA interferase family)
MDSKEAMRRLEADGWTKARTKGDHVTFKKPGIPGVITITHPSRDLSKGLLRSIFRIAGWKWPP